MEIAVMGWPSGWVSDGEDSVMGWPSGWMSDGDSCDGLAQWVGVRWRG